METKKINLLTSLDLRLGTKIDYLGKPYLISFLQDVPQGYIQLYDFLSIDYRTIDVPLSSFIAGNKPTYGFCDGV